MDIVLLHKREYLSRLLDFDICLMCDYIDNERILVDRQNIFLVGPYF